MGVIRLLLALSVVLQHIWRDDGYPSTPPGPLAVQAFFMISGFYMSLILASDFYSGRPWKFLLSRAARIFPSYWITLAASVWLTALIAPQAFAELWSLGFRTWLLVSFANLFIVGQDVIFWLVNVGGDLLWTSDAWTYPHPWLSDFMFIGPAWTLALELMFYALAPVFVKLRTLTLWCLVSLSVAGRIVAYSAGLDHEPWGYRFFPFELAFFLLGIIAQRRLADGRNGALSLSSVVVAICFFEYLPKLELRLQTVNDCAFLALMFWVLPTIFQFTKSNKIDALIGELSYPIYLTHMVVFAGLSGFGLGNFWLAIALTFATSAILAFGIDRPLSDWRHRIGGDNRQNVAWSPS